MKKNLFLFVMISFAVAADAQLLVSDSSLSSLNNGITFTLNSVDSSFHNPGDCKVAYAIGNVGAQSLINSTYRTYDYFGNGNLRQLIVQSWNAVSSGYVNLSRTTLAYYQTTNKVLTSLSERWVNNTTWENASLQTNTYNGSGYLTLSVFQNWNTVTAAWEKNQDITYYNNANGLADSAISKDYENNVVTHQTKDIYAYVGTSSNIFRVVNQTLVNNQWQDSTRSTFTYNPGGKPTVIDNDAYDPGTQTWTLLARQTFVYNANGDLITLTQTVSVSGFSLITQTRYKPVPCTTSTVTPGELCAPLGSTTLAAGITGASYQWQVNTGSGFTNISNNANYAGATTATLSLTNAPSTWYGYQYRCVVAGQNSSVFTIRFVNKWTGATNTQWEVGSNWSCGVVPNANTDAIISTGTVVLNSNASVRSLSVNPGAKFTANTGFKLTITH